VQGIVVDFDDTAPVENVRALTRLVDPQPVLTALQLDLAHWMSAHYLCPLFDTMSLMLPGGLRRRSIPVVTVAKKADLDLTEEAISIMEAVRESDGLPTKEAKARFGAAEIEALIDEGLLLQQERLPEPRVRPKTISVVRLSVSEEERQAAYRVLGRDTMQATVLAWLAQQESHVPLDEVEAATGASTSSVRTLANKGLVRIRPQAILLDVAEDFQPDQADKLTRKQRTALEYVQAQEAPVALRTVREGAGVSYSIIRALEEKGILERRERPTEVWLDIPIHRVPETLVELRGATKQVALLAALAKRGGQMDMADIRQLPDYSPTALQDLENHDLVRLDELRIRRDPLAGRTFALTEPPRLTPAQANVWKAIRPALRASEPQVFLLHGVTGSGKTEIYLRAAQETVEQGKQAIALVPEIALTPQTVQRFAARFQDRVAIFHSQLSQGERYDEWRRIRAGEVDVVIGPRSALLTPLPDPGLIILDEEHETAYKQEEIPGRRWVPSYHAREVAIQMAKLCGATVCLGSATPDLGSYHRAQRGEYTLFELPHRIIGHRAHLEAQRDRYDLPLSRYRAKIIGNSESDARYMELPPVQIVDLRQELYAGNRSIFSRTLQAGLQETLERGEQAILFLNRRGSATFVMCRHCGQVIECPHCQVPLTYHSQGIQLVCNRCNYRTPSPRRCPECGSRQIKYFGIGTQRVESVTRELYPDARIARWDSDAIGEVHSHEELLDKLEAHEIDIVIGTQMLAKGLDLPLVTLVGVITADTALNLPDYRAPERTFQLLEQVAGRAGRSILGGRVIVQTYAPEHYAIEAASEHDYHAFYRQEIAFRRSLGYPPFSRLVKVTFASTDDASTAKAIEPVARQMRKVQRRLNLGPVQILGPTSCFLSPSQGRYRWQLLLLGPDADLWRLLDTVPLVPGWYIDIDPVSVL
jgi:primosomal protein N' (replication factor Y)